MDDQFISEISFIIMTLELIDFGIKNRDMIACFVLNAMPIDVNIE